MNETLKTIHNHRSIRKYLDKDVPQEMLDQILLSAQSMPTSINGQQLSIIVIRDKDKKNKIAELAGNQIWISQAPVFLVFVADFYKTRIAAEKNNLTQEIHESVEGTLVATFDAGIAMGGTIAAAESLGLGIVPIGAVRKKPYDIIKLLGLPEYTYPIAGLVVGYPADESAKKPRMPFKAYVHYENYNMKDVKDAIDEYDEIMINYYKERGDKSTTWSKQVSETYKQVYFPEVYPSIKAQGFKNDK
ncbi:NADPH-dependent oxidoreductase [Clostridium swellfunianum]|uniref:NADPH-dependent oxidoreductase n=1 Tax=Clostridium swellfunianum TaxID=1367462 RepID=UPI00202E5CC1|nr:NADPH-dependent oxidoreductase [Clostridium swellfunianum]MCM0648519.1 NADPH-dependent oxidoreductase [Clostridium swellfunianum]